MNTNGAKILFIWVTFALASCAVLERPRESTIYAPFLMGTNVARQEIPAGRRWRLAIEQPRAIAPFDGTHMVVAPMPGEMQFYKGARWRDTAPAMLQDLMTQAFEIAPQVSVVPSSGGGSSDFVLRSELRALTAEYGGGPLPTVNVQLVVQLVRRLDGDVVATHAFSAQRTCDAAQLPQVFAAFQEALNQLVGEIVAWATDNVAHEVKEKA